jgi:hypothetical protein
MLVKTISVTSNAPFDTNEKEKEVNKQSLRTVVVGLREALAVEESTLSVTEATHWKELVQLVAQEEEEALNEASKKAREEAKEKRPGRDSASGRALPGANGWVGVYLPLTR